MIELQDMPYSWDDYKIFKEEHTRNGVVDYIAMLRYIEENHDRGIGLAFGNALLVDCLCHIMEKISSDDK